MKRDKDVEHFSSRNTWLCVAAQNKSCQTFHCEAAWSLLLITSQLPWVQRDTQMQSCYSLLFLGTVFYISWCFITSQHWGHSIATTSWTAGHHTYRKHTHRTWFIPQNIENINHTSNCWVNKYFTGQKNASAIALNLQREQSVAAFNLFLNDFRKITATVTNCHPVIAGPFLSGS